MKKHMLTLVLAVMSLTLVGAKAVEEERESGASKRVHHVVNLMESLPKYHEDESTEHYYAVAESIVSVTSTPEEVAGLLAHGWHESKFAAYVVEGRCSDGPRDARCDPDKNGVPRARTPFQVWKWCSAAWKHPDGSAESLKGGAKCALSKLKLGLRNCQSWEGAFAGMKRGGCTSDGAKARAGTMYKLLKRMRGG